MPREKVAMDPERDTGVLRHQDNVPVIKPRISPLTRLDGLHERYNGHEMQEDQCRGIQRP